MGNPYTKPSISGYNSSPPSDDGSQTSANEITWAKHKTKLADPIKTLLDSVNTNVNTAFGKIFLNAINAQSTNYTVQESDQGKLISCTNTITVTLLAAATAGSNFALAIRNAGSGTVTVDGNGSETINGSTTVDLVPGDTVIITSDGSNWEGAFIHAQDRIVTPNATGGDQGADTVNASNYYRDGTEITITGIATGQYTGDGATSQSITGVGFTPVYLQIYEKSGTDGTAVTLVHTTSAIIDDDAAGGAVLLNSSLSAHQFENNRIISLDADGFTVDDSGADSAPNTNGQVYNYLAIG